MEKSAMIFALAALSLVAAEEISLNVNVKKPMAVVSDKFLSITLDPVVLFNSDSLSNDIERSTSMAKALAPAYVRIAGPRSNSYVFERSMYSQESNADPGYTFSETHWMQVNQWADRSGLEVVASLAPQQTDSTGTGNRNPSWDPRNALDLISFSDHMAYNTSWQLGYECQTQCDLSGSELGRYVQRLRNMLDAFPRYAEKGLLVGPDVVSWKTRQNQQYLQDFFNSATGSLSAVTWHPDFAGVSIEADGVSMHQDDLAFDKESLYRIIGRFVFKKPLWLAESKPEECKPQFLGALVWARRLGSAAKLGAQVIMRQPDGSNLFRPTPDYWVSVIHKMLVGREVLDTRIFAGNRTHVNFYGHCTRPSSKYEPGSLTIFGINLTPSKIVASLKGLKVKLVHKYVLLPGYDATNRMFSETILLNNEVLNLVNGKDVPNIQPVISNSDNGVKLKLPSGGIGFWVLPGLKIKSCMSEDESEADRNLVKNANKRMEDMELPVESEPEYEDSEEESENSGEGRKRSPRVVQPGEQLRKPLRRISRHSRDDRRDEQHSRAVTAAHDFDKSDKPKRGKEHPLVEPKGLEKQHSMRNKKEETKAGSHESMMKSLNPKPKTPKMSLPKIQEKKKRQIEEVKKKQQERKNKLMKNRIHREDEDNEDKPMSTGKVIEALTLITKVENAVKGLGKDIAAVTFGSNNSGDVDSGSPQSANSGAVSYDDELLDEVLHTEKSKSTSIPAAIEDQLKALYNLLSEKKDKKNASPAHRPRRDIDRRGSDDPLGLSQGIYMKRRARVEEGLRKLKEKRQERLHEIRQRIRERLDLRKENRRAGEVEDSEEEYYGFPQYEPQPNFPPSEAHYPINPVEKNSQPFDIHATVAKDNPWSEAEAANNHMPHEFYENIKAQPSDLKEFKGYQSQPAVEVKNNAMPVEVTTQYPKYEPVTQPRLEYAVEQKSTQSPSKYYPTNSNNYQTYDYKQERQTQQPTYQTAYPNYDKKIDYANYQQQQQQPAAANYQQDPSYQYAYQQAPPNYPATYQRTKRQINDIDYILDREMIAQDDNNFKDCQCRVIRGVTDTHDCPVHYQNVSPAMTYGMPLLMQTSIPTDQNLYSNYYGGNSNMGQTTNLPENSPATKKSQIEAATVVPHQRPILSLIKETEESLAIKLENEKIMREAAEATKRHEELRQQQAKAKKNKQKSSPPKAKSEEKDSLLVNKPEPTSTESPIPEDKSQKNLETQDPMVTSTLKNEPTPQEPVEVPVTEEQFDNAAEEVEAEVPAAAEEETPVPSSTVPTTGKMEDKLNPESQSDKLAANRLPRKIDDNPTQFFLYKKNEEANQTPRQPGNIKVQKSRKIFKSSTPQTLSRKSNADSRPNARPTLERENPGGRFAKSRSGNKSGSQNPTSRLPTATENYKSATDSKTPNATNNPEETVATEKNNDPQPAIEAKKAISQTPNNEPKNTKLKTRDNSKANTDYKKPSYSKSESKINYDKRHNSQSSDSKYARSKAHASAQSSNSSPESKNIDNTKTETEPQPDTEKKSRSVSAAEEKSKDDAQQTDSTNAPKPKEQEKIVESTSSTSAIETSTTPKPESESPKKENQVEMRNKPQKPQDQEKLKQARLMIRAEALAALRKENESKRAKKMIENSMKPFEIESAKFEEYTRRRRDQLEKLKMRLRAKRERILQQYRDELLEVVNEDEKRESRNAETDNSKKIFQESSVPDKKQLRGSKSAMSKLKVKDHVDKATLFKDQNRKYNKEPMQPRRTNKRTLQRQRNIGNREDLNNNEYTEIKRFNRQTPQYYNNDYYSTQGYMRYAEQPKQEYAQQPIQSQQTQNYQQQQQPQAQVAQAQEVAPVNENYNPDEMVSQANDNQEFEELDENQENINDYDELDTPMEDAEENPDTEDENVEQDSAERIYQKSKRSSLGLLEDDPAFYEEDEPSYEHEFYSRPSSRYYQRTYRHYPYRYETSPRRYKRESLRRGGEILDGPLSFSLGLEKSKMIRKKSGVDFDEVLRKKRAAPRVTIRISATTRPPTTTSTPPRPNKNVKKVRKAFLEKNDRKKTNSLIKGRRITPLVHPKRSLEETINPKFMCNNEIDREEDMDDVLDSIIEMKEDEKLLEEFDKQKSNLIQNYRDNQNSLSKYLKSPTAKSAKKPNLESIITDTVPKIENVITGSMKKAQNFTENLEEFIDDFEDDDFFNDEEEDDGKGRKNVMKASKDGMDSETYSNNGKWSSRIFYTTIDKVKKIFDIFTCFGKMFTSKK